ncbi:MAG: hypothetical protein P8Y23_03180 [Candidatus Lokiarchaeota archaeon]
MQENIKELSTKKKLLNKINQKKLLIIILAFAVYLIILTFIIVPLQGGLISSTDIVPYSDTLPSQYESDLPLQELFGIYGRSIAIAFVMLSHVLYANLHLGGSWVAVTSETMYIKNGTSRFNRLSRSITLFVSSNSWIWLCHNSLFSNSFYQYGCCRNANTWNPNGDFWQ